MAPVVRPAAAYTDKAAATPIFTSPVVTPSATIGPFVDSAGNDQDGGFVQYAPVDTQPDPALEEETEGETDSKGSLRGWIEWIAVALGAVLVALLIRAFVLQAFYIPSESMEPTLHENDRIMVNKLSYRLHDVRRGDLIVFRRPANMASDEINDLIKRVIALPNETIELRGSDIYIDDQKLTEPYLADGTPTVNLGWVTGCANPPSERNKCLIPPGHVFVMGDNRTHSSDGRVFGPIDEELIVGRAFVRIWPPSKLGFL
jgi:signal peptidase I